MRFKDLIKNSSVLVLLGGGAVILAVIIAVAKITVSNSIWPTIGVSIVLFLIFFWFLYKQFANGITSFIAMIDGLFAVKETEEKRLAASKLLNSITLAVDRVRFKLDEAVSMIKILGDKDDLNFDYLSQDDRMGQALVEMNETMRSLNAMESKRKWKVEGLAKFAEHLREDDADLSNYLFNLTSELVRYTKCNQGAFYIKYEDEAGDEYMELKATYAYDKRKFEEKKISKGQGLLGQCMVERTTVYLRDVPENYVNITSGLGEAVPKNIIIIPLLFNDTIFGAVELASFNLLEDYQIEFLEELAESIAASISSIKVNENTRVLLEEAQGLTTELQSREEEMRQNMEELAATQEDMQRNQVQLNGLFDAIDSTLAMMEFDTDGAVNKANKMLLEMTENTQKEVSEMHFNSFMGIINEPKNIWAKLIEKQTVSGEYMLTTNKGDIWIEGSLTPVLDINGNLQRVLLLAKDITQEKELRIENDKREVELNSHVEAINKTIASCEYNMEGVLVGANEIFLGITGFKLDEIKGKHHFDLIPKADRYKPQTELMWGGIKDGKFFSGEFKLMSKNGKELWLTGTYNPILDPSGNPYKVMMFAQFTTDEKEKKVELTGSVNALKSTLPIIEIKADRVFKSANKLFFEEFGYTRMELRGKTFEEIVGDPTPNHIVELFNGVAKNEFVEEIITFYNPAKNKRRYRTTFTPIFDLEDKLSKIVIVMVDMEMVLTSSN